MLAFLVSGIVFNIAFAIKLYKSPEKQDEESIEFMIVNNIFIFINFVSIILSCKISWGNAIYAGLFAELARSLVNMFKHIEFITLDDPA